MLVLGDCGGMLVLGDCGTLPGTAAAPDRFSVLILVSIIDVSTASS